jgi:hypothetical protein
MVKGLEDFSTYFSGYKDEYALIGGAACDLWLNDNAMNARATKDLDLVLIIEALGDDFIKAFWDYIRRCGYRSNKILGPDRISGYYHVTQGA